MKRNVLVIDIGGTNVKLLMSAKNKLKFDSGPEMTPRDFVRNFHETTTELDFATVSIGFPSVVRNGKIVKDPKHLGKGWVGFNFSRTLKRPTRVINDAAQPRWRHRPPISAAVGVQPGVDVSQPRTEATGRQRHLNPNRKAAFGLADH